MSRPYRLAPCAATAFLSRLARSNAPSMLSLDAKHRLADRLGHVFAAVMRGVLVAGTALLPKNGREHVRRVAIRR
ncbi:hypothetical protein [Elioraea thermophila]|uniref:hypothetical protein n=1 Tax=Elioraea thermophila TaxID=2185104 RepID=UPI0013006946|nr:hypothetical protein [Elioraea thermophila]